LYKSPGKLLLQAVCDTAADVLYFLLLPLPRCFISANKSYQFHHQQSAVSDNREEFQRRREKERIGQVLSKKKVRLFCLEKLDIPVYTLLNPRKNFFNNMHRKYTPASQKDSDAFNQRFCGNTSSSSSKSFVLLVASLPCSRQPFSSFYGDE